MKSTKICFDINKKKRIFKAYTRYQMNIKNIVFKNKNIKMNKIFKFIVFQIFLSIT